MRMIRVRKPTAGSFRQVHPAKESLVAIIAAQAAEKGVNLDPRDAGIAVSFPSLYRVGS